MAYTVSEEWREKCYSGESLYDCRLYIGSTLVPIEQIESIVISSPIIDTSNENSKAFYVGSFISQQLTIKFTNLDGLDIKSGNEVSLYIGQYTDNAQQVYEEIPIGLYLIDELAQNYYETCEIVCLDYAIKFASNLDYSEALHEGSITVDELLAYICEHYGVALGTYPSTNGDVLIGSYDNTLSGKYYISCIAEIKGCNAKIGRDGTLNLIPLKSTPAVTIDATAGAEWELGEEYQISKVVYNDAVRNYTFGDDTKNTLFLRQDNPFIVDEDVARRVYTALCGEETSNTTASTTFNLTNTTNSPMQLDIKGNTSQVTYTGKNLLNYKNLTQSAINVGYSVNSNEEVYDSSPEGDNRSWEYSTSNWQMQLEAGTYTLSFVFSKKATNQYVGCRIVDSQETLIKSVAISNVSSASGTFTLNSTTNIGIEAKLFEGVAKIQLEKNSSATSWEKYVGGAISPSPNYPQDVNVVSGLNNIKICGKNLLNLNDLTLYSKAQTYTYNILDPNRIEVHSTTGTYQRAWFNFVPELPNAPYYRLSAIAEDIAECTGNVGIGVDRYPKGSNTRDTFYEVWFSPTERTNGTRKGLYIENVDNEKYDYRLAFFATQTQNVDNKAIFSNIQIEKGNIDTSFEEYKGEKYSLYLGVENLFKYPYSNATKTENGITFTDNGDGSVTINGTATSDALFYIKYDSWSYNSNGIIPEGKYTLSRPSTNDNIYIYLTLYDVGGTNQTIYSYNNSTTFTVSGIKSLNMPRILVKNGATIENLTIYPQLEKGSIANEYTPYNQYVELCKIGNISDILLKNTGKNLFNDYATTTYSTRGVTVANNKNSVVINGTYDQQGNMDLWLTENKNGTYDKEKLIYLKPNTSYACSITCVNGVATNTPTCQISSRTTDGEYTLSWNYKSMSYSNGKYTTTFTTDNDSIYIAGIRFFLGSSQTCKFNDYTLQIQVEENSSVTNYEPYGIGKWYLKRNIGKISLRVGDMNNNEDYPGWNYAPYINNNYPSKNGSFMSYSIPYYCNIRKQPTSGSDYANINTMNGGRVLFLPKAPNGGLTQNQWKATYPNLPFVMYIPLVVPEYILLNDTLQEQLNEIYNNVHSWDGQTNIVQINNDLGFLTTVNSYYTEDRFSLYSLKHKNYGDLSLDAWDIIEYDVDGTTYPALNHNTTTYAMTVMSETNPQIPTVQQEATTNVIGGTQSQKIKRVYTTVDNLEGQITLNAEEIDGLQENVGKLQITANGISSTVTTMQGDISTMQTDINQKADSVTFNVYKSKVDDIEENGVTKVKNTMVAIDETGLSVSTNTSKIKTTMSNNEFRVETNDENPTTLTFIGYDENEHTSKSEMDNLTVNNYFVVGVHRLEALPLSNPKTGTTETRTSCFYIGT